MNALARTIAAADDLPWFECGNGRDVYARPAHAGSTGLWFDPACERSFACVEFRKVEPGEVIQLHGRGFLVNAQPTLHQAHHDGEV